MIEKKEREPVLDTSNEKKIPLSLLQQTETANLDHVPTGRKAPHPRGLNKTIVTVHIGRKTIPDHSPEQSASAVPLTTLREAVQGAIEGCDVGFDSLSLHLCEELQRR